MIKRIKIHFIEIVEEMKIYIAVVAHFIERYSSKIWNIELNKQYELIVKIYFLRGKINSTFYIALMMFGAKPEI